MLTAISAAVPVRAATVTSANDRPTTLQAGQAANHTVTFTTPTGATAGLTMTVGFETAFDTSSLTEDDVDIADDGVDLTTSSAACPAAQVSVGIASDTITFTLCAGTTIAATSVVTVEIGTNATASGTGANRATNPSGVGTYYVSVAGTFGDSGSIALPIGGDDSVSVSATVVGQASPQPPAPPPSPGDVTPPVISNVVVSGITETSATISWDTDETADSKVDYGLTGSYGSTASDGTFVSNHSVSLTGLTAGKTYHFRVRSSDPSGNTGSSGDFTFTTPDFTPPVLSDIAAVDITETSARIIWTTDEDATSGVNYGLTTNYGSTVTDGSLATGHSMLVTGLADATTYHFRVRSTDAFSNEAVSGDFTFTTVANLPPANVIGFTVAPGNKLNTLTWSNPPDADLAGVRILACTDEFPSGPTDTTGCTVVYSSLGTSFVHTGLTNAVTYYYGAYAFDQKGQFSSGALGSGTPSAPETEPPPPEPEPEPVPPPPPPGAEQQVCGDGQCVAPESVNSCPADCAAPPTCGNAVCDAGETPLLCPSDCPVEEVPETTVPETMLVPGTDVAFLVASRTISLVPNASGDVNLLSARPLHARLSAEHLSRAPDRVQLVLGPETFAMAPDQEPATGYSADIITPPIPSRYVMAISIFYPNDLSQTLDFVANVQPDGQVYEILEGGVRQAIATVRVTLVQDGQVWDGSPFGQFNPTSTTSEGTFAWYVPAGGYAVRVEKSGYEDGETQVGDVPDHIVNPAIRLSVPPPPIVLPIPEAVQEQAQVVVEQITETLEVVREIPQVQTAAKVTVPVIAVATGFSVAVLASSFQLLSFLQYLLSVPFLFFARRKRRGFGIVYHAITKAPVDLATVRLYRLPDTDTGQATVGRLVASRVTDKGGRYFFLVQPGRYRMIAMKPGFVFPSEYLKEVKDDKMYLDVYHGEPLTVSEKDAVITANIPMDPLQSVASQAPARVQRLHYLRLVQNVVAMSGIIISLVVAVIFPSALAWGLVGVQIVVFLLIRRLAAAKKPKSWGIVYDKQTGRPLANAVARVFEPKYNKLLETAISDSKGRYTFLLGPNEYFAVFEKSGFRQVTIRPIDYTERQGVSEFTEKVALESSSEPEQKT